MIEKFSTPGLFEGTARYYARYRSGYPFELIDLLIERFKLNTTTHVLDLGCGTGQLAITLASQHIPIHAVDPDLDMLAEGLRSEKNLGVSGIAWYSGDDKCINQLHLPLLRLCTMGASFHWMDRDQTLTVLNDMIDTDGGIAVVSGGGSVWSGSGSGWPAITKEVVAEFLGPNRRAGGGTYQHPTDRHEVILARSPFSKIDELHFITAEEKTVEDIVGLQLSTSYASPAQLGDRINEFRQTLTERLLELEPSGVFQGETTIDVLIATR